MFESYRKQDFYLYQISHSYLIQIWLKKCKFKINNWQKTFWNFYNWHCMFCQCFTILQIRSFQKQILLQTSFELRPGLVSSRVSNGVSFNHHWSYLCKKVCSQEFQFNTDFRLYWFFGVDFYRHIDFKGQTTELETKSFFSPLGS